MDVLCVCETAIVVHVFVLLSSLMQPLMTWQRRVRQSCHSVWLYCKPCPSPFVNWLRNFNLVISHNFNVKCCVGTFILKNMVYSIPLPYCFPTYFIHCYPCSLLFPLLFSSLLSWLYPHSACYNFPLYFLHSVNIIWLFLHLFSSLCHIWNWIAICIQWFVVTQVIVEKFVC